MIVGVAVCWLVRVGTHWVAEVKPKWVGPKGWVDDGDIVLANFAGVVTVVFKEAFFEGVVHGVDGGFTILVAGESIEVGFLDEEQN